MFLFSFPSFISLLAAFLTLVHAHPAQKHGAKVSGIGVPVSNSDAKDIIANRYIVVYKNNVTDDAVQTHQASVMTMFGKRGLSPRSRDGRALSGKMEAFSMMGWRGMSLDAEDGEILEIASADEVSGVRR
jgi:hypothetical protein